MEVIAGESLPLNYYNNLQDPPKIKDSFLKKINKDQSLTCGDMRLVDIFFKPEKNNKKIILKDSNGGNTIGDALSVSEKFCGTIVFNENRSQGYNLVDYTPNSLEVILG